MAKTKKANQPTKGPVQQQPRRPVQQGKNRRRAQKRPPWALITIIGILVVVVAVVGIFVAVSRNASGSASTPTEPEVLDKISHVSPEMFKEIGDGGVSMGFFTPRDNPPLLKGPNGKPEFFFYSAEFCPICAAQRWATVVALSRFGTFTQLHDIVSDEGKYATLSFYQHKYSSQYIDFVSLEEVGNNAISRPPLEKATPEQQKLLDTYNAPPYVDAPGYPLTSIGNRYFLSGSNYSSTVLGTLNQKEIAQHLSDPHSDVAKGIIGSANYLTAAICTLTDNQPANVCKADPIPALQAKLPATVALQSPEAPAQHLGIASMPYLTTTRRDDVA